MNPTRYLVSAESYGTVGNDLFDGTPQAGRLPDAIVTKIVIAYSSNRINSIQVNPQRTGLLNLVTLLIPFH